MVKQIKKRASLPTAAIGSMEALLFCGAFVAGGLLLKGGEIASMILPMLAFAAIMMLSMVFSGVYKPEVKGSALRLFRHNLMGFGVAVGGLSLLQMVVPGLEMSLEFLLFTVLASFFVVGTIRPVLSNMHGSSADDRRTA
jgi:hypothetical protein